MQITVRQTEQEAEQILKIKLKSSKAKPVKQAIGSKLSWVWNGLKPKNLESVIIETNELLSIFTSIGKTLQS